VIALLATSCVPTSAGIAILRYRLWDIDRVVSRGIAWALVTTALVALFATVVIALQGVLGDVTQGDTLAVAASTLLAAALFQPLRQRVQRLVDRRFDRTAYDAQRTIDSFAERLRDEVDLDDLERDIRAAAATTLHPASTAIWLRDATNRSPAPGS
jgi:hypothetical protein